MSDGNQITTYDRVVTGFVVRNGRFFLTIRYENSDTGESRAEESSRYFNSESAATEAAEALAKELQARIGR